MELFYGKKNIDPSIMRKEALKTALSTIEKKYGQGSIMYLSDDAHQRVPVIPTGSISLDLALGIGGIPRGRVIEIYGPESSGKTTLALQILLRPKKKEVWGHLLMQNMPWMYIMPRE